MWAGVVLVVGLCLGVPTVATAGWHYTTWGMTPEQVIAASHGQAVLNPNATRDPYGRIGVVIVQNGDNNEFTQLFFDNGTSLASVVTAVTPYDFCGMYKEYFRKELGIPTQDFSLSPAMEMLAWRDPSRQTVVSTLYGQETCSIVYAPLR
jgi:hypothetical protein